LSNNTEQLESIFARNLTNSRDLKVLQVIDRLQPGGAERIAVELTNLLNKYNIQTDFLTMVGDGSFKDLLSRKAFYRCLQRKRKLDLRKMRELRKIAEGYDIVHVHMTYNFQYLQMANLIMGIDAKIICHDHNGDIDINASVNWRLKYLFRPLYYIGVCAALVKWAVSRLKVDSNHSYLLPNIITKKEVAVSKSRVEPNEIVLVGNIRKTKNIEFALQLIKELRVPLHIYGQIVEQDYYDFLHRLIRDYNIADLIVFHFDCFDIQPELCKYKMALHTSKSESGPLVIIEYLAQGLPFLTFETGEVVHAIKKQFPMLVINNFNVEDWIKSIRLIESEDASSYNQKLREAFYQNFSEKAYLNKCLEIYQSVLRS